MSWKAKIQDRAYWKNSIYAAWFALGIRVARNHATGWYHSMRSLTTRFWSLKNKQERTLFSIKFNASHKWITISLHLDGMNQPTWNNSKLCLKSSSQIVQIVLGSAKMPSVLNNSTWPRLLLLNLGLSTWCFLKQMQTVSFSTGCNSVPFFHRILMPDRNFPLFSTDIHSSYLFSATSFHSSSTSSSQQSLW